MFGLKDRFRSVSNSMSSGGLSPVAMDFGASGVKLLQLSGAGPDSAPNLVAAGFLPTPENLLNDPAKRLAWQLEQLPAFVRKIGFKGKRAVCAIPTSQSFCKHLQVQGTTAREIASMVRDGMAMQLGCAPDALLCRHVEVGPAPSGGGKIEVIAIVAARAMIDRLMQCIRDCRMEPVGIQAEAMAVLRSFDHLNRRAGDVDTTSLYLDMGAGHTRALIAHGTQLVFAKPIPIGGLTLDLLVAKQLKLDIEEAHRQRIACGELTPTASAAPVVSPPPPPVHTESLTQTEATKARDGEGDGLAVLRAAMSAGPKSGGMSGSTATAEERRVGAQLPGTAPVQRGMTNFVGPKINLQEPLDALTEEVTMCLRYHDALFPGRKLTRTIFVGGESRHIALCRHVARVLKAPASVADPLARIARTGNEPMEAIKFDQPQPGWAVPVGLCLGPTDL